MVNLRNVREIRIASRHLLTRVPLQRAVVLGMACPQLRPMLGKVKLRRLVAYSILY